MSGEGGVPRLTNLAESMGMEITEFGEGSCVVELTVGQMHLNLGGMAHGGCMQPSWTRQWVGL